MNKTQLIDIVAANTNISKTAADKVIKAFTDTIASSLQSDEQVSLIGFGTFLVRKRAARIGRNINNQQNIEISAANIPAFRAGKSLKEIVN